MAYAVDLQLGPGFAFVLVQHGVDLDPVPGVLGQHARRQGADEGSGAFVRFGLDVEVVIAEARKVDAHLFGGFVRRAAIRDIRVHPDQVGVVVVGAEKSAWKEDGGTEPEVIAFDDVVRRVGVENASRVGGAFRGFDVDFERRGACVGLARVSRRSAAAAVIAHLIEIVWKGERALQASQPGDY